MKERKKERGKHLQRFGTRVQNILAATKQTAATELIIKLGFN